MEWSSFFFYTIGRCNLIVHEKRINLSMSKNYITSRDISIEILLNRETKNHIEKRDKNVVRVIVVGTYNYSFRKVNAK